MKLGGVMRRTLVITRTFVLVAVAITPFGLLTTDAAGHPLQLTGAQAEAATNPAWLASRGEVPLSPASEGDVRPDFYGRSGTISNPAPAPEPLNVYAATINGILEPEVAGFPQRVYVPNSTSGTVDVIDPATFRVIDHYGVGAIPHHVAPSWDMRQLYVDGEGSWILTTIDPKTGRPTGSISVPDPYNLYFTPDGTKAIVVAERLRRLDFRDPHTWQLIKSVIIPAFGVDHLDFSSDGSYLLASTEYSGLLVRVDTVKMEVTGFLQVGGLPVDVRLSPDASVFYVANQGRHGVSIIDPVAMKEIGFLPTGRGAHGLYISRDTLSLYVSNRLEGTISVIDMEKRKVVATWRIGGSPDMLQLSPDGKQLWASGRFDGQVYVVDTTTGALLHRIRVGGQPHGLSYFPNTGRYSTGHNGVYR
jgi:YVTN family beta-propeller protein